MDGVKLRTHHGHGQQVCPSRLGDRTLMQPVAEALPDRGAINQSAGAPIRTLVVNDHLGLLEELGRFLLAQPGIDLAGMSDDATEALEEARALRPQLIVLGVQMRGIDGFEAADRVRRMFPGIGIIMTGAAACRRIAVQCTESGADAYIPRKRIREELLPAIHRAVARRGVA